MSDFHAMWLFHRVRLDQALDGLTDPQAAWRPHPAARSITELLFHMAGSEHYFGTRFLGLDPGATAYEARLDRAVRDGFLNEEPVPFTGLEATLEQGRAALAFTRPRIEQVLLDPTPGQRTMRMVSPLGPEIDGVGGLVRVAGHPSYHTGQIWLYRGHPEFPC